MSTPTPTPEPWIADGYDLRQKHGRMIAYFGPHHTPADEYPLSCRLQDEANCQWVAALPAELSAAKAECERIKVIATEQNDIAEQHRRELAQLRAKLERADVLYQRSREVEHKLRAEVERLKDCAFDKDGTPWKTVCGWWSAKYDAAERQMGENAALAATEEEIK